MMKKSACVPQQLRWGVLLILFSLIATATSFAMTGREKLVTDHATYVVGETIKIGFTNGPANTTDWIGIYKEGETPGRGGVTSTKYLYVGGGSSAGAALGNGEVTFTGGLPTAGNYVAYFLEKDGYRVLAQDAFTVTDATAPQVRTDKQVYQKNETITVSFARGPGNAKDWIAIYPAGVTPGSASTAYRYVDNTTTGETGLTDGTVTFANGLPIPGKWVAYLLENDDYTVLAQDSFEIVFTGPGSVTIETDHQHYLPGQPVRVSFDGGPGNPTDWIGVYLPGQRPGGGPTSTDWRYVGGTQTAGAGLTSGEIVLSNGFTGPQEWWAYFFLLDGYTIAGNTSFEVLADGSPLVQLTKRTYDVGEAISVNFTNAPGNAKDWIGIYPKGVDPATAGVVATLWNYTDGTRTGTAGIIEGQLPFATGLSAQDEWTVYLFENDTYTILAREDFTVRASGVLPARIVSVSPANGAASGPSPTISVVLENRGTTVNTGTISVKLNGVARTTSQTIDGNRIDVAADLSELLPNGSTQVLTVSFQDSAGATVTSTTEFTVSYNNVTLPQPLFLETFDSTAEGALPMGWIASNQSGTVEVPEDLGHLGSLTYHDFVVVDSARLAGDFLTYGDGRPATAPVAQVLSPGTPTVVNGAEVTQFATNKILFALSGYHGAGNEVLEVVTPAYNLSANSNIYLSFRSLYEQNQDNIAGVEVSNDGGITWHPVIYYMDSGDIIRTGETVDTEATFNTERGDIARLPDGSGGTYGSFLKAPISEAGAFVQARGNDDPTDGTRVEYIRVPEADNKAAVRFRLFYAGTDSWYWGVDNFGIYSQTVIVEPVNMAISGNANSITVNYDATATLESTTALGPNAQWETVQGASNGTYVTTPTGSARFFRARK